MWQKWLIEYIYLRLDYLKKKSGLKTDFVDILQLLEPLKNNMLQEKFPYLLVERFGGAQYFSLIFLVVPNLL